MIVAIYVDHELMGPMENERESDAEGDEKKYNHSSNVYTECLYMLIGTKVLMYYDNIRISV